MLPFLRGVVARRQLLSINTAAPSLRSKALFLKPLLATTTAWRPATNAAFVLSATVSATLLFNYAGIGIAQARDLLVKNSKFIIPLLSVFLLFKKRTALLGMVTFTGCGTPCSCPPTTSTGQETTLEARLVRPGKMKKGTIYNSVYDCKTGLLFELPNGSLSAQKQEEKLDMIAQYTKVYNEEETLTNYLENSLKPLDDDKIMWAARRQSLKTAQDVKNYLAASRKYRKDLMESIKAK